ncbi:ligand-dependent nuclear receptor corepressor-like protein isoform X5 [Denticeps clupeoides]|uniref:ligand-dependent nuclear receptor corepressor-like protein isoform X5 n=1 Tax=Denticeps clupeoides TaxID=299321 RepID=UPI0010A50AAF|nr:ligand-dependent nuclear receptor corepressor-like protein isoform X5 [Denticeps clupeoides]
MATQCRSSKCTAERKGFRRELDSWRHKLIHCVGFESILEGIYGPRLLKDLSIFDDCEPEVSNDWSLDANCSFCNLQLEKLSQDHNPTVASPQSPSSAETPPPQGQSNAGKLQCQADQFLNAVFRKKELSQSCDSNIPHVARELMKKMIKQFALEYASKSHDSKNNVCDDHEDPECCGLPKCPDEDMPLDLTVSRNHLEADYDGVLDLSRKKTVGSASTNAFSQKTVGRLQREDYLERSSEFSEGLLSKALKDIQSGSLDVHKAAILYGIPQRTLLLQLETLAYEDSRAPQGTAPDNGSDAGTWENREAQLVLQRVAAWARAQAERTDLGKMQAEHFDFRLPASTSYLHQLTLEKVVTQLREKNEILFAATENPTPPPSPATTHIKIPQVRMGAQPKPQVDLGGLMDAMHQVSKASASDNSAVLHRLKVILPQNVQLEAPASLMQSAAESCLLQADISTAFCLSSIRNHGSVGSGEDGDDGDRRDKQPRKKRGRYRQYDHDILEEAITMVMSGKMSVSKAQGIYGVPHSTLEYKVKERMGTLKTPPKKKLRLVEQGQMVAANSGTASRRF